VANEATLSNTTREVKVSSQKVRKNSREQILDKKFGADGVHHPPAPRLSRATYEHATSLIPPIGRRHLLRRREISLRFRVHAFRTHRRRTVKLGRVFSTTTRTKWLPRTSGSARKTRAATAARTELPRAKTRSALESRAAAPELSGTLWSAKSAGPARPLKAGAALKAGATSESLASEAARPLRSGTVHLAGTTTSAGSALATRTTSTPASASHRTGRANLIHGDFAVAVLVELLQCCRRIGDFLGGNDAIMVRIQRFQQG
jgi:hypothetical protein